MSLNWNLGAIENWEALTKIPVNPDWTAAELDSVEMNHTTWSDDDGKVTHYMNPITSALIWSSILHGFSKITRDNYHEVWLRLAMFDGVCQRGCIWQGDEDRSITLEEVYEHIGLSTNVSSVTKTEFYKRMMCTAEDKRRTLEAKLKKPEAA